MSNKAKLLGKNRKIAKRLTIEVGDEKVEIAICKPTMGDRARMLEAARLAGEINEKGDAPTAEAAIRMTPRIVAICAYDPDTMKPLFNDADLPALLDEQWFQDVLPDCQRLFAPDVEELKGK